MLGLTIKGDAHDGDVAGEHLPLRDLPPDASRDPPSGCVAGGEREGRLTMPAVSRREFIVASAAACGGLLLSCRVGGGRLAGVGAEAVDPNLTRFVPNAWVRIGSDDRVTLVVAQVEMGKGGYTSMPMFLAEGVDGGRDQVQLDVAPPAHTLYP